MLQLIAECMFCNFITKALFYAKYFDIFVTTVVFCWITRITVLLSLLNLSHFYQEEEEEGENAPNISFHYKRIISQMCSHFYLWLIVYLLIKKCYSLSVVLGFLLGVNKLKGAGLVAVNWGAERWLIINLTALTGAESGSSLCKHAANISTLRKHKQEHVDQSDQLWWTREEQGEEERGRRADFVALFNIFYVKYFWILYGKRLQ